MPVDLYLLERAARKAARLVGDEWLVRTHDVGKVLKQAEILPKSVDFETTNICNANCVFCAYQYQQRPTGVMTMELYRRLVEEVASLNIPQINFTPLVGDPLVDPHILERVAIAKELGISEISFFTNGILFRKVGIQALLTSGLTDISLSTAGFDDASYQRVYRSTRYRQMYDSLVELLETNQRMGRPIKFYVHIRADEPLSVISKKPDFERIAPFIDGVDANLRFDSWSGKITKDQLLEGMKLRPVPTKAHPCWMLYWGLTVLWDGQVTACGCRDLDAGSDLMLGSILDSTLLKIWRGAGLSGIRRDWIEKKQLPPICQDCTHYNPATQLLRPESLARVKSSAASEKSKS